MAYGRYGLMGIAGLLEGGHVPRSAKRASRRATPIENG